LRQALRDEIRRRRLQRRRRRVCDVFDNTLDLEVIRE